MQRRDFLKAASAIPLHASADIEITPEHFGAIGDGVADDTVPLQSALKAAVGKRVVFSRHYRLTSIGLYVPSNSHILFKNNAKLELLPHSSTAYQILRVHDVGNVLIENPNIDGRRDLNKATDGEWGMAISICGSTDQVKIINPVTVNCWGDGIYIGSTKSQNFCNDVYIKNHRAENNRRQGISVISAKRLVMDDPVWINTNGTAPQAGLDIEPNSNADRLDYVRINNPKTVNCKGNGIAISLQAMRGASERVFDIKISGHRDIGSASAFECSYYDPSGNGLSGLIEISSLRSEQARTNGMVFRDWGLGRLRVDVINPTIIENNASAETSEVTSVPFLITRDRSSRGGYVMGGISIENPTIRASRNRISNSIVVHDYSLRATTIQDVTIRGGESMMKIAPAFMPNAVVNTGR